VNATKSLLFTAPSSIALTDKFFSEFQRIVKSRLEDDAALTVRLYIVEIVISLLVEMATGSGDDYYYGSDNSDDTDTTGPFSPNKGSPLVTPISLTAQFSLETQQSNMSTTSFDNV